MEGSSTGYINNRQHLLLHAFWVILQSNGRRCTDQKFRHREQVSLGTRQDLLMLWMGETRQTERKAAQAV